MTSRHFLFPALALSVLLGGCAGPGPHAQQGAAAGGAIGAITGALIANNNGGYGVGGALLGAAVGAMTGSAIGAAHDQQNAPVYGGEAPPPPHHRTYTRVETVSVPPSAPRSMPPETIPPPPAGVEAVWIPGYWDYNGASYIWTPGRWEIPPPDKHSYIAAHWETHADANVFVRGTWQ